MFWLTKMDAGIGLEVRISKDTGALALGQEKRAEEKPYRACGGKGGLTMERMTYKDASDRWVIACNRLWHYFENKYPAHIRGEAVDRLAAYEDTGLEPEEIAKLRAERDAAINAIPHTCETCLFHAVTFNGCTLDHDCTNPDGGCSNNYDRWKWRGPTKENCR